MTKSSNFFIFLFKNPITFSSEVLTLSPAYDAGWDSLFVEPYQTEKNEFKKKNEFREMKIKLHLKENLNSFSFLLDVLQVFDLKEVNNLL